MKQCQICCHIFITIPTKLKRIYLGAHLMSHPKIHKYKIVVKKGERKCCRDERNIFTTILPVSLYVSLNTHIDILN